MDASDVLTKCPVCDESFKSPRMAPACGHSYCTSCMKQLISASNRDGFTCVVCRAHNAVRLTSVDCLPVNLDLQGALLEISNRMLATTCTAHPHSMNLAYCSECEVVVCKDECALFHPRHNVENLVAAMSRVKSTFETISKRLAVATKQLQDRLAEHKKLIKIELESIVITSKQRVAKEIEVLHKMVDEFKAGLSEAIEHDLRGSAQRLASYSDLLVREHLAKVDSELSRVNCWLQSDESLGKLIAEKNNLTQLMLDTESFVIPAWQPKTNHDAINVVKLALLGKLHESNLKPLPLF